MSRAVGALHGTALAIGAVTAGLTLPWVVRRFGRTAMMRGGLLGLAAGCTVLIVGPVIGVTLLGAFVVGTAGSVLISGNAPILSEHHPGAPGAAAITEANGFGAGIGALAPLMIGGLQAAGLGWRVGMAIVVVAVLGVLAYGWRVRMPPPPPPEPRTDDTLMACLPEVAHPRLPRRYWAAWLALVLFVAIEFSMTIWASDLMVERHGWGDGAAAMCVSAIVVGLFVGRVVGGRLALRLEAVQLLLGSVVVATLGWLLFWRGPTGWLSVLGLFVVGLGLSVQFPVGIARAISASAGLSDKASGFASVGAGLAVGTAPWVLGALADSVGVDKAFLLVPALLLAAGVLIVLSDVLIRRRDSAASAARRTS